MKKILLFTIAGLSLAGIAYADFSTTLWKYQKPVTSLPVSGFVKVNLDKEVSTGAKSTLSDIRVIANNTEETAYQLVTENETVRSEYRTTFLSDLSSKGGETMFILDLKESGVLHDHLTIQSDSKNFKRKVLVYAADEKIAPSDTKWRLLTRDGYIYNFYDETSGFNAGSGDVSYPENSSRYLKVVIANGEGSEVHITSAHVLRLSTQHATESQLLFTPRIAYNSAHKSTEISIDLGGHGIPTHRITLATEDPKNFSRRAIVEESDDNVHWSAAGDGYVFSLATPLFTGAEFAISYRESQARYIRVIVLDQDDLPVAWDNSVRVDGVVRAVVFQVIPGSTYALYYGNSRATETHYDLARYFQYVESTNLTRASLGAQEINPGYLAPVVTKAQTQGPPNLLNGALILLVAVVTFLLIAHLKKLKMADRGVASEKKTSEKE